MSIIGAVGPACKALITYFLVRQGGDPRIRRLAAPGLALVLLFTPTAAPLPAQPPRPAATTDGADPLGRLDAARRIARPGAHLVLVSSGLSTVDPLNLVETGWNLRPDQLAGYLAARGALPDLTGLHVVFAGLGIVAGD